MLGALWRYAPAVAGARAALEVGVPLDQHGALAAGFEEQSGVRREGLATARRAGTRQGLWGEWQSGRGPLSLALRHEAWGGRFARHAVRTATAIRLGATGPFGIAGSVAHTVFRTRRGESLYLAEAERDRLVLRALSGAGERSRVECRLPALGGTLNAAVGLMAVAPRPTRAQWTLDWTRRARTRDGGSRGSP
jgi:hypothetical protein